jgi:S-adenosylmethionine decarboxylase
MNGLHILCELLDCACEPALMHDVAALRALCLGACTASGLQVVSDAFHAFVSDGQPQGATGVVVLAESHLAIHTWPEFRAVTLDIYVCNVRKDSSAGAEDACRALLAAFRPQLIRRQDVVRGAVDGHAGTT